MCFYLQDLLLIVTQTIYLNIWCAVSKITSKMQFQKFLKRAFSFEKVNVRFFLPCIHSQIVQPILHLGLKLRTLSNSAWTGLVKYVLKLYCKWSESAEIVNVWQNSRFLWDTLYSSNFELCYDGKGEDPRDNIICCLVSSLNHFEIFYMIYWLQYCMSFGSDIFCKV